MPATKTTRRRSTKRKPQPPEGGLVDVGELPLEDIRELHDAKNNNKPKKKWTRRAKPDDLKMQLALELIQCARDLLK